MNQQHKAPNQPMIHQIRENDQEHWQRMVQAKLIEIPFRPNKEMDKHPAEMLAELRQVIHLNRRRKLCILGEIVVYVHGGASAAEPGGEVGGVADE